MMFILCVYIKQRNTKIVRPLNLIQYKRMITLCAIKNGSSVLVGNITSFVYLYHSLPKITHNHYIICILTIFTFGS